MSILTELSTLGGCAHKFPGLHACYDFFCASGFSGNFLQSWRRPPMWRTQKVKNYFGGLMEGIFRGQGAITQWRSYSFFGRGWEILNRYGPVFGSFLNWKVSSWHGLDNTEEGVSKQSIYHSPLLKKMHCINTETNYFLDIGPCIPFPDDSFLFADVFGRDIKWLEQQVLFIPLLIAIS